MIKTCHHTKYKPGDVLCTACGVKNFKEQTRKRVNLGPQVRLGQRLDKVEARLAELEKVKSKPGPVGWQCPVCKRGLSPYVTECPCYVKAVVFIPMTSGTQSAGEKS